MRGSWDLGGSCIAADTACGRKTALPSGNPCAEYPLSLSTHQSVRLHEATHQSFFGPGLERKLTIWTRFSVRVYDRAWEASFTLFLSTAERRLTRAFFGTQSRSSYELVCWLEIHTDHVKRSSFSFLLLLCFCVFCLVLYQVEISTILQFPDQHKPL